MSDVREPLAWIAEALADLNATLADSHVSGQLHEIGVILGRSLAAQERQAVVQVRQTEALERLGEAMEAQAEALRALLARGQKGKGP